MSTGLKILDMAEGLASHSAARQSIIAENIAHADTPGFKARDLTPFAQTYAAYGVGEAFRPAATRPGHETGGRTAPPAQVVTESVLGAEAPNGNDVSIEDQMVRGAEVQIQHDMAMGVWKKALDILRTSLGSPR